MCVGQLGVSVQHVALCSVCVCVCRTVGGMSVQQVSLCYECGTVGE